LFQGCDELIIRGHFVANVPVITRLYGSQTQERWVPYDDAAIQAGDTLADFRKNTRLIGDISFEDPESAGEAALDRGAESVFLISEVVVDAKSPKAIVLWSARYAGEMRLGSPVYVSVLPHSGSRRPPSPVSKAALGAMNLDNLRTALVKERQMAADDRFLDQGVPVDPVREKTTNAVEILSGAGICRSVEVMTRKEAEVFEELERWKEQLPPIDAAGYRVSLEKPVVSEYEVSTGAAGGGQVGFGAVTVTPKGSAMAMTALTLDQQEVLLRNCGLYPRPVETAACAALRINTSDVEFGAARIITCERVRILQPQTAREDRVTFSHTRELHRWQMQLVDSSSLAFSIPLLFGLKVTRSRSEETDTLAKGETVHLGKLLALPKAEVILEGVGLSQAYLEEVRKAVRDSSAPALLDILARYGPFVATHFVIGGKVIVRSSTVLGKASTRRELAHSFGVEVATALVTTKVLRSGRQREQVVKGKMHDLIVKTVGGAGEASSSETGQEGGADWLLSVATQPQTWKVIGYKDDVIRPTIDHFPEDLKSRAVELLRGYFESSLERKKSVAAGGSGGTTWDDDKSVTLRNRIAECAVMMDQNIDAVQFTYVNRDSQRPAQSPWRGNSREGLYRFTTAADDDIVAVEVGWNQTVDSVIFHTRNGNNMGKFVGRGQGAARTHVFEEPRIRGFHGRSGHFLDALGVYYYDLPNRLPELHRSVLLSLERYLYRQPHR
jgi:hypothetical protein